MHTYIRYLIGTLPVILLYAIGSFVLDKPVQIVGFVTYFYLIFVLSVSPIAYISSKFLRLKRYGNHIVSMRRPIGIVTGFLGIWHATFYFRNAYDVWERLFSDKQGWWAFIMQAISGGSSGTILGMNVWAFWSGFVGMIVMIVLLFTSNNHSQRILGSRLWKGIQRLAYPLFILVVLHIYWIGGWKGVYLYPAIILIATRFYAWFDKNFTYTGRSKVTHSGYRRFLCVPCGYIYDEELGDPEGGLAPGTKYEAIPNDWVCPVCGAAKKDFVALDGHYNPLEKENSKMMAELVSKEMLTKDVIHLVFHVDRELDIEPGQYCNLVFDIDGEFWSRSYSVAKYIDNEVHFIVRLQPSGLGSAAIKKLQPGDTIELLGPFGSFILQQTRAKKIFVATGTGLSPVYRMMCSAWDAAKELHFGVRTQDDIFFLSELEEIPNLDIHIYLSQEASDTYHHGRVSIDALNLSGDEEVYLCGNPAMIDDLTSELDKLGHEKVFHEKFI